MAPGKSARYDTEYERCGVCNIFMAGEPLVGKRMGKITERKTKGYWAHFVQAVAESYREAAQIVLVMDNLSTRKPGSLHDVFPPEVAKRLWDRFDFAYTPKRGSRVNVAEIELRVLNGQCLNRRMDNVETMRHEVNAWQRHRDHLVARVNWRFTTEDAQIKLHRPYPTHDG